MKIILHTTRFRTPQTDEFEIDELDVAVTYALEGMYECRFAIDHISDEQGNVILSRDEILDYDSKKGVTMHTTKPQEGNEICTIEADNTMSKNPEHLQRTLPRLDFLGDKVKDKQGWYVGTDELKAVLEHIRDEAHKWKSDDALAVYDEMIKSLIRHIS